MEKNTLSSEQDRKILFVLKRFDQSKAPTQPPFQTLISSRGRGYAKHILIQGKTEGPSVSQDALTKARAPTQPSCQTLIFSSGPVYGKNMQLQGKTERAFLSQDDLTKARTPSNLNQRHSLLPGDRIIEKTSAFFSPCFSQDTLTKARAHSNQTIISSGGRDYGKDISV